MEKFLLGPFAKEFFKSGIAMRVVTLNIITSLGVFYILAFFTYTFYTGEIPHLYAALAYTSSFVHIVCFVVLHTEKCVKYFNIIKIAVILNTILFSSFIYVNIPFGENWAFLIPLAVIFVMNVKWGSIICLVFFVFMFAVEFILNLHGFELFSRYACIFFTEVILIGSYCLLMDTYSEKLQKDKEEIKVLSITDHLTKLYNRRYFSEMIARELSMAARQKKYLCFLMLDVDKFKNYNDAYGHLQGDELLISLSKISKKVVKRSSDLLFRMGGEEFGVLLPDTDREGGLLVAENIKTAVSEMKVPLLNGNGETKVTVSVGVACILPHTGDGADNLLKLADSNLYKAKATGRNKVVG